MDDKGEVKCIKFSIGNKILAVQRTAKSVVSLQRKHRHSVVTDRQPVMSVQKPPKINTRINKGNMKYSNSNISIASVELWSCVLIDH